MKKLFSVLAVLFVLGTTSTFALGIGAQAGYTIGGNPGAALTLKLDKLPPVFAVDFNFGSNGFSIGGTADWWIANPNLVGPVNFYYGPGIAASFSSYGNGDGSYTALNIGVRLVGGLNLFIADFFEPYLQLAWQPTFGIALSGDDSYGGFKWNSFPVNLGFRFWF